MASEEQQLTPEQEAAADVARAKAEARRKRILEGSNKRMGLVSGEQVKVPTTDGEEAAAATEEGVTTTTTPSSSSRMQAMRRRRFKNKSAAKEDTPATSESNATEAAKPEAVEPAATAPAVPTATATKAEGASPPVSTEATKTSGSQRKYKGVAATRRQKLKEKAAAKSETDAAEDKVNMVLKKPKVNKLPIILHLLTVLALFGMGLKFGTDIQVQSHVSVHRELLAPQQHGLGLVNRFMTMAESKTLNPKDLLNKQSQWEGDTGGSGDDEFAQEDDVYEPNIDPLFQLDLDLYTQGNGILAILARIAVYLHRLNLYFFYYMPGRMIASVMLIPNKLLKSPPIMFFFALFIRQFSQRILGAKLPTDADESKKEDVLAMLKNGVMNFLANSFPTLVEFYDAFTHLRSDMFIVLCGLFCGLAWNHHYFDSATTATHDEL